ncbi:xanthine dehydrogenase family protein molybdopterin-binding subunit [Caldisericum exile]|uniref:Oxidoreductase molybdopterin-binding subunit n=1 Tax=Caldisericum exile (strain DSM 21853 / NBRC 104410 / AZM16c01) TaxID=511051 RepID=A0A7U6GDG6_CALEA|nr:xanthine dehydrogenase family protein molybdopterin-binding subunit [Caldisericum exile]BAL80354.1 oxidoreductase molybdopterin-binding subunit [Caldisericum exile AZM16c01]
MEELKYIGKPIPRIDALEKATGKIKYMSDLKFPNMAFGKILRAKYPHAKILKIDTSKAEALPGVVAVITHKDVPGVNGFGIVVPDMPVLCKDKVRYIGDAVAAVAAETEEIAEKAIKLIDVEYEPLPVVEDPEEAMEEDAPKIHEEGNIHLHTEITRGDVESAFKEADLIIEETFFTGRQDHTPLETEGGVAFVDEEGVLHVYVGSQYPQRDQLQLARCLNWNPKKIHVVSYPVGGAFGRKDELSIQPILALLAIKAKRPVKITLSREESIIAYWKRHPFKMRYKVAFKKDGTLLGVDAYLVEDKGAYSSLGGPVLNLAVEHACGPYRVDNVHVDGYAVFTNNGIAGAFRGFGAPQTAFAIETIMDIASRKLGIDPIELRKKNALRKGDRTSIGNVLTTSVGTELVLDAIKESYIWKNRDALRKEQSKPWLRRGVGMALTYQGTGLGVGIPDYGGAILNMNEDGGFTVRIGTVDYGQGIGTSYAQIVAEAMHVPIEKVKVILGDSFLTADSGPTSASRGVYTGGKAAVIAADKMKEILKEKAAELLKVSTDRLDFDFGYVFDKDSGNKVSYEELAQAFKEVGSLPETEGYFLVPTADIKLENAFGLPHHIFAFSAHAAYVEVNTLTGEVSVIEGAEAVDGGVIINRQGYEAQVEGGFVMGMGYGLMEHTIIEKGIVKNPNFSTYIIPTIKDAPRRIEAIPVINPEDTGPFRSKGIAETVMVATPPAVTNAIYDATGARIFRIPATPEVVYFAIKESQNEDID